MDSLDFSIQDDIKQFNKEFIEEMCLVNGLQLLFENRNRFVNRTTKDEQEFHRCTIPTKLMSKEDKGYGYVYIMWRGHTTLKAHAAHFRISNETTLKSNSRRPSCSSWPRNPKIHWTQLVRLLQFWLSGSCKAVVSHRWERGKIDDISSSSTTESFLKCGLKISWMGYVHSSWSMVEGDLVFYQITKKFHVSWTRILSSIFRMSRTSHKSSSGVMLLSLIVHLVH